MIHWTEEKIKMSFVIPKISTEISSIRDVLEIAWGPDRRKMVKFNPGLSQISSMVSSSKNIQLEVTKYCWAFTTRNTNDAQNVTLSNTKECKIQKRNKLLILD